ncbi:MAG: T9SS type A sorting domain-containing protein [Flavobacteriales bacterium]|nr:T9SS type A sorting domain-containing protein [Flavobacteriales bacterium]
MKFNLTIFFSLISFTLIGQSTFKKLIHQTDPTGRSTAYIGSVFLENNNLAGNKEIVGRGVYAQTQYLYSPNGDYLKTIEHPKDSLVPYAVPEEYEYGPWKSEHGFLVSYSYSTGAKRYFFTVKYDTLGNAVWKADTLRVYNSVFSESYGEFIEGTKDYKASTYLRLDKKGKTVWKKDFQDSTSIISPKSKGLCVQGNLAYIYFSNGVDSSEIIKVDTNGTILKTTFFSSTNLVRMVSIDSNFVLVSQGKSPRLSLRNQDFTVINHYDYLDSFSISFQDIKLTSKGLLVYSVFSVNPKVYGLSKIPELRLLDKNLNYNFRRYFRINEFDTIPENDDNSFSVNIRTYQEDAKSGYRIFIQSGGQKPNYAPFASYHLLKTDPFLNVNDSIQLGGTIRLFEFDSTLIPLNPISIGMIEGIPSTLGLKIFPNPTHNQFSILGLTQNQLVELTIYDLKGGVVFNEIGGPTNSEFEHNLQKGLYVYEIKSDNSIHKGKLVVD